MTQLCNAPLMSTMTNNPFVSTWKTDNAGVSLSTQITIPTHSFGTYVCAVDWGDGIIETGFTTYNDARWTHTYSIAGTYTVKIRGIFNGISFNNGGDKLKLLNISRWGILRFGTQSGQFFGCSNLTITAQDALINNGVEDDVTGLAAAFMGCTSLTSIPTDLFRYTRIFNSGFTSVFKDCTGLTSIPSDLFRYHPTLTASVFTSTFENCTGLTSIPADLFRYNTAMTGTAFRLTFKGCTGLVSIPTDLFRYNTAIAVSSFRNTFENCTSLTSIPADLFRYNTAMTVNAFFSTFKDCTSLTSIPVDLFRYNTAISAGSFSFTFQGCTNLATVPSSLFKYNTLALSFSNTFNGCIKAQFPIDLFYDAADIGTRFLNQSVSFENCFERTSFTGIQGTAPDLWNVNFGTGTPIKTNCFSGDGNSPDSFSNYASIPVEWGAIIIYSFNDSLTSFYLFDNSLQTFREL